jgi:hypothetical protein
MIRRREFITLLGGAAAWPLAARAQQNDRVRRVGALFGGSAQPIAWFRERLAMLGWVEGGNLRMDYRLADGDPDRIAAYAEELVNLRPDLIFAMNGPAARAVQQRTAVIPIVFVGTGDPASNGLVGNIAHPGSNMTGFANYFGSLGGKWLELFKEAVPGLTRVAHLVSAIAGSGNPRSGVPTSMDWRGKRASGPPSGSAGHPGAEGRGCRAPAGRAGEHWGARLSRGGPVRGRLRGKGLRGLGRAISAS